MAFDAALADRVRSGLAGVPDLVEKKMFGGLAFLLRGNISVGVHGAELIVRIDPAAAALALTEPGVRVFDITGRPMKGWLMVSGAALRSDDALSDWLERGLAFARSLPAK